MDSTRPLADRNGGHHRKVPAVDHRDLVRALVGHVNLVGPAAAALPTAASEPASVHEAAARAAAILCGKGRGARPAEDARSTAEPGAVEWIVDMLVSPRHVDGFAEACRFKPSIASYDPTRPELETQASSAGDRSMKTAHIKTELPGPKARELLARDALVVSPVVSARLSVRDVARQRRANLGRRRQPLPGFRGRHRRVQHRPQSSGGRAGHQGCGGAIHPHLLGLLARGPGEARGAHAASSRP